MAEEREPCWPETGKAERSRLPASQRLGRIAIVEDLGTAILASYML